MANELTISDGNAPITSYADDGAIDPRESLVLLTEADTSAMTLANPSTELNGHLMTIMAAAAQAYTLTVTGGFGGGGTGEDVATFSGAIGDSITLRAVNGTWCIVGTHQVTIA